MGAPMGGVPQQSSGPSMMGMMGSSKAGSMAGSVIGHGISNAMFGSGGSSHQAPPPQEYQQAPGGQPQPCAYELESFFQCLQQNNQDQAMCQAYLDQLQYCRQSNGQ